MGALLVVLFVIIEALLLRSYGATERTTREFSRTTDATTALANAQRETLLLGRHVTALGTGDPTAPIAVRRGLLARQVSVIGSTPAGETNLRARLDVINRDLARFDAAFAAAYGDGPRARSRPGREEALRVLERLEVHFKEAFDDQEHALYAALHDALHERAMAQLLIAGLSAFTLLTAAALALLLWRAVRGDFARAYGLLDRSEERFRRLVEQLPAVVYQLELADDGRAPVPLYVSPRAKAMIGVDIPQESPDGLSRLSAHIPAVDRRAIAAQLAEVAAGGSPRSIDFRFQRPDGEEIWLRDKGAVVTDGPGGRQLQGLLFDVTEAKRAQAERDEMELELRLAQKLEAVGQLAAGVAHEINTPIQFVGNTVHFLQGAFHDLLSLQELQEELERAAAAGTIPAGLLQRVAGARVDADLAYLRERVPAAFERAQDGIERVATIVGAMREFAHPAAAEQAPVDLNRALRNTLVIAANEYKYVADLHTDFADLPPVVCNAGDVNQVFLNLIVNAAHAISDRVGDCGDRGEIRVQTRREAGQVVISIGDTGCGIPAEVEDRVFDPFFTTKEVGRGTGQGLAIARSLVVERHGGSITFETEPGHGTTFHVTLPLAGGRRRVELEAAAA